MTVMVAETAFVAATAATDAEVAVAVATAAMMAMVTGCQWFHMPIHCILSSSNALYVLHIDVHAAF
jgi:hypothetical protein